MASFSKGTTLAEKLGAIHESLAKANLKHAFGGAISLAYCIDEPRGTRDIDVNIFISAERARDAAAALPTEVEVPEQAISEIVRDGQTRVWWDDTPVDLFLNNLPIHEEVANEVRWVPFAGSEIPVLSCQSLVIFKAFFNRTKDWADIEAVAKVEPAFVLSAADRVEQLVAPDEEIITRLRQIAG
ncbi:MAG: hypothetical protein ACPGYP_10710 [Solirubrobacterales bacterium]